ncbi:MAG TPA: ArdC family protein [Terriglobales bacterium]|nr:ArdC family protein [Terriglobales bacterium]
MLLTSNTNTRPTSASLARASVDSLVTAIESGHNEVFSSYLETMARFHTYSARNVLLIAAQCPNATHLEGVRSWNELGRFVRPGEKGVFIFAPAVGFTKKAQKSEENGNGKKNGKNKKPAETVQNPPEQVAHLLGFRGVWVFDISQTGGEEQPESRISFDPADGLQTLLDYAQLRQLRIEYTEKIAPAKGTSYRGLIRLVPGMEPAEAFPVLLREVASQLLYETSRRTFVTRALHQQETQAAAFVVCEALGLDAKSAFADCQLYYGDARLLTESLEVVHRTAAQILGALSPKDAAQSNQAVQ